MSEDDEVVEKYTPQQQLEAANEFYYRMLYAAERGKEKGIEMFKDAWYTNDRLIYKWDRWHWANSQDDEIQIPNNVLSASREEIDAWIEEELKQDEVRRQEEQRQSEWRRIQTEKRELARLKAKYPD